MEADIEKGQEDSVVADPGKQLEDDAVDEKVVEIEVVDTVLA